MKILRKRFTVPFAFALLALVLTAGAWAAECHYSYEGATGPEHWGEACLPSSLMCVAGTRQSPIDLPVASAGDLAKLSFHYRPAPLKVENTGHTIEMKVESDSYLRIGQERYKLVQFHFHTPSEHRLHGQEFPMELHFVHSNALGELAVVGVFLREGAANPLIQEIWDAVDAEETEEIEEINPEGLLPHDRDYYRYAGSLTTPPCTEGVRWHVLEEPVDLSTAQVDEFRAIFPLNARPLQPLNGRPVLESH